MSEEPTISFKPLRVVFESDDVHAASGPPGQSSALPSLGKTPLEAFQRWAAEHDQMLSRHILFQAQMAADLRAVDEAIRRARSELETTVRNAPSEITRAWSNERSTVGAPVGAGALVRAWSPGGLIADIAQHEAADFRQSLGTIQSHYYEVKKRSAMLRGAAVRAELIPPFKECLMYLARLVVQGQAVEVRRDEDLAAFRRANPALADAACATLRQLVDAHLATLEGLAPTAQAFDDPAWTHWEPSSAVRELIWYWQSIPAGLVAGKSSGAGSAFAPGAVETIPVVNDFRSVPGFVWPDLTGAALKTSVHAAQALVLRLMAAIPPGKCRFTFIDPLGSGNNVAPFLELAEWDPLLIDSKAWCQQREIAEKLGELNAHLELVIQKYLKGRFESIEEYNTAAGEVAEPYRFVVVFDFPAQFDEQSNHLLARLIQNGRRCGVYVLVVHNADQKLPYGVNLEATLRGLHAMPTRGALADASVPLSTPTLPGNLASQLNLSTASLPPAPNSYERGSLVADAPPELRFDRDARPTSVFTRVMLAVGERGKGSNDVEVTAVTVNSLVAAALAAGARNDLPEVSQPIQLQASETWWTGNAGSRLAVPIGRAGARDPAMFTVDTGQLSGALVVGRPGSGKSTLMHSIIAGIATWYSPAEVELYLLDFKQGVEFLEYGQLGLPHARCVAIESEREFGVAILESVAAELVRRSELFKDAGPGVANIGDWRQRTNQPLPRIVVVIDEFQELLNRSDALSSRTAQLLDNLIRQGRAFGIHLLLGSQQLGSIDAAGTGINAVFRLLPIRIVLPSDPSDAAAALGEKNDGALYLNRQGEGIYNPASGNPEHNRRFQGTFLDKDQRHAIIGAARAKADAAGFLQRPRIFNGAAPAEFGGSSEFLTRTAPANARSLRLPIGLPMTLDPELCIDLTREAGQNVAFVCRNDQLIDGFGSLTMLTLASQLAAGGGVLHFVDCSPAESATAEWLDPLLPSGVVRVHRARGLATALHEIRAVVEDRLERDDGASSPLVLTIWGLHRARDIEAPGVSFGFDTANEPNPAEDLEFIVRNGPEFGVHTMLWCDSVASLGRRMSRAGLRDCAWRLASVLSSEDADMLDVRASSLKPTQLACTNVDSDRHWRVRGYARPNADWLRQAVATI